MNRVIRLRKPSHTETIQADQLDFSMLGKGDFLNLILQRSNVLNSVEGVSERGKLIKAWSEGNSEPLEQIAEEHNVKLAYSAMTEVAGEFDALVPLFADSAPKSVADIGCGYGLFDLVAAHHFSADVHLIDMETNDAKQFGFDQQGAAYSDLGKAFEILTRNGVPSDRITLTNPVLQDVMELPVVDLAVSFLACGFHFPIDAYMPFFRERVAPGGRIILDLRKAQAEQQLEQLSALGTTTILSEKGNRIRVLVQKPKIPEVTDLSKSDWRAHLAELGNQEGFYKELGDEHSALFVDKGDTLIVTFENLDHVYDFRDDRMPWGYGFVTKRGWSMLGLMAHDWTWYRDEAVYDFFDRLKEEGFFDRFKKVVFYGASMGGYAAAAFSAAAPGSTVILISPQATLCRETAPWEYRYLKAWRRNFNTRYGYAPEHLKSASKAYLFYDPRMPQDAMHATLFQGDNIEKFRCRFLGHRMASLWVLMGVLKEVIESCVAGDLTRPQFYRLMRRRRDTGRYLREFLQAVKDQGKPSRVAYFCEAVLNRRRGPKFRQSLRAAQSELGKKD